MKLRFGEFPEDHHFVLITRPFVEGCFKFLGWLVVLATLEFAYLKTESKTIFALAAFFDLLILGYVGAFVDWVLKFRRYRVAGNANVVVKRGIKHWIILAIATVTLVVIANFITDRVVTALVEFQQRTK
jgi:hypothetical protein